MKINSTLFVSNTFPLKALNLIIISFFAFTVSVKSQTTYSNEKFAILFNSSEAAPVNTTFQGSIGTWSVASSDVNSTMAVKTEVSSTDLKFVINGNNLSTVSQNTATSPNVDLSMITCTAKFDFFFDIYTSNVAAGNTGTTIMLQLFDGTTWNTEWSKTAAQLFSDYGANSWQTIGMMISTAYMGMTNFKYRFITQNAAGNMVSTTLYIDNVKVINYSCPATAAVGNKVWNDDNSNGMQDAGENGVAGITVKLAIAPGDTLTTTTDGSGIYMFSSLPPAGYKIVFPGIAGMIVTNPDACGDEFDSDINTIDRTVNVFLSDGEINTTIDAGYKLIPLLPVKMTSFQGAVNRAKAELKWVVADNENADRFAVEKSIDGITFSEAGVVFGTNKNDLEEYYFKEAETFSGKIYYRLKSFDKNGKAEYSKIIMLSSETGSADGIKLIGNPVTDKLTFNYVSAKSETISVRIYDMSGKILYNQVLSNREGVNTASILLPSILSKGIYVLELNTGNARKTTRFVKQ